MVRCFRWHKKPARAGLVGGGFPVCRMRLLGPRRPECIALNTYTFPLALASPSVQVLLRRPAPRSRAAPGPLDAEGRRLASDRSLTLSWRPIRIGKPGKFNFGHRKSSEVTGSHSAASVGQSLPGKNGKNGKVLVKFWLGHPKAAGQRGGRIAPGGSPVPLSAAKNRGIAFTRCVRGE